MWGGVVRGVSLLTLLFSWFSRQFDEDMVNGGFDHGCAGLRETGRGLSRFQSGQVQVYLRVIGAAFVALVLILIWRVK